MEGQRAEALLHGPVFARGLVRVQVGVGVYLLYKNQDACLGHFQQDCGPVHGLEPSALPGTALGEAPTPSSICCRRSSFSPGSSEVTCSRTCCAAHWMGRTSWIWPPALPAARVRMLDF